jgi:hypothetical protein
MTVITDCKECDCTTVEEADDSLMPCDCECHGGVLTFYATEAELPESADV